MRFAVTRADRAEAPPGILALLAEPEVTPEGYLVLDAIIATPCILDYTTTSGRKVRERARGDMLAAAASSLAYKPAAHGHPPVPGWKITPQNAQKYTVGNVVEVSTLTAADVEGIEGGEAYVGATRGRIVVQHADAIDAIRAGKIAVSAAYTAIVDDNDGKGWDDDSLGHYDYEQVSRTPYNHVAVGIPSGRAAGAVFRVDAAGDVVEDPEFNGATEDFAEVERADGVVETIETTVKSTRVDIGSSTIEKRETSEVRSVDYAAGVTGAPDFLASLAAVLGCEATPEAIAAAVAALKAPPVVEIVEHADSAETVDHADASGLNFDGATSRIAPPPRASRGLTDSINAARAELFGDNRG